MTGSAGHSLVLQRVTHRFGAHTAADDVSLEIGAGEIIALLGPSGCGKTTLLRIIAGFLRPSSGEVLVDGAPITQLPPNRRQIGIVFQSYAPRSAPRQIGRYRPHASRETFARKRNLRAAPAVFV